MAWPKLKSSYERRMGAVRELFLFSFSMLLSFALSWQMIFGTFALSPYKGEDGRLVVVLCGGGTLSPQYLDAETQDPFKNGQLGHAKVCPFAIATFAHVVSESVLSQLDIVEIAFLKVETQLDFKSLSKATSHQPRAPPQLG